MPVIQNMARFYSYELSKSCGFMVDWWNGDKIEYSSEGWKMLDGFDITGKIVIDKNQYSTFFQKDHGVHF